MEYLISYLIRGRVKKYQEKLIKKIGSKFGRNCILNSNLPMHITLKAPFKIKEIKELEKVLKGFSNRHKSSEIKISGFGNFKKFIIFLNVKFSKSAKNIQKELIVELEKMGIQIDKHDKKFTPHSTISYGSTKKSFGVIWNYLMKLKSPSFNLKFDNIVLMKKIKSKWEVHKEFNLK